VKSLLRNLAGSFRIGAIPTHRDSPISAGRKTASRYAKQRHTPNGVWKTQLGQAIVIMVSIHTSIFSPISFQVLVAFRGVVLSRNSLELRVAGEYYTYENTNHSTQAASDARVGSALSVWEPDPAHADTAGRCGWARNSPLGIDVAQYRQRIDPFATWTPRQGGCELLPADGGTIPHKPSFLNLVPEKASQDTPRLGGR
jgi:hypothetical protein